MATPARRRRLPRMLTTATPATSRRLATILAAYWRSIAMVLATEHGWCLAHGVWYPGDMFAPHERP